ncbi:MAG TPA: LysR family transcriptional regulator [bacterium]|nr:LysR family transcriptional regulator [bacterium]
MNLHQLRIFHTVARLGSYSRAAEELKISQPSVSIQVGDLERSLGVDLFEQLGKRIYLTEAGRVLEEYAQRILGLFDEASAAVAEVRGVHRGRLAIGATNIPGTYLLPRALFSFQERFPQITVSLEIGTARRIQERVLRNEVELGVVGWEISAQNLVSRRFYEDEIVLVVPPGHRLAAGGPVPLGTLRDERVIMRERGSGTREAVEAALREANLALPAAMELGSGEAIKEAVAAGLGVSFLSSLAVAADTAAGRLVRVPLEGITITQPFVLIQHRDKRPSQAMTALIELLGTATNTVGSKQ